MDEQLRQAVLDNTAMMNNLTGVISNLAEIQRRSAEKAGINTKDLNDNFNRLGRSAHDASAAQESITKANKKYEDSMNSLNAATASTVTGLKNFTTALLNSERSFGKYGDAVTSFGDAIGNALKALGPIGAVAGSVVQGLSKVAEVALKQADNIVKAYDDLAKVGGAGAISTKQLMDMGHAAGLMSKDLGKLTGVIKTNSKEIAGLGLTAADGIKVFGQLTAITSEQRMAYSKLGVSQEDLMKTQADYLALQLASGNSLKGEVKDKAKLQKATLEYQDRLLELSNLTGEDVESLKKKQKEAAMELNFMVKNRQDELRERELRAQGRTQEADQLAAELKARKEGNQALVAAAPELGKAVREFQATGTASGEAAAAMQRAGLGNAIKEYNDAIKQGKNVEEAKNKLINEYNKAQDKLVVQVGANAGLSSETAKAFGMSVENMERRARQEKDMVEAGKQTAAQIAAGKTAKDPALDARAKLTELEIKAGVEIEKFIAKLNPLISGFNPTTIAGMIGLGAATGLGMWLAGKLAGGIFGKGGGGGMPGIPSTGGIGGGRAAPSTGGMGAPTAGGRAAPTAGGRAGKRGGDVAGTLQTLGQGGGGMLENAAKGLAAFANPKVAVGAAAFGAAIVAIGAGIAGATWIVSKALPTLAENLQSFEKLDGEKLVQAGKGVAAIGGGLAVFGVGGAAAGIGSIMSNLGDAIAGFFGAKTPIQKLEEFSKLDINPKKTKENAEAFAAFSAAMVTGAAGIAEGFGTIVTALGGAVTNFFKVDPPLRKFVEFSKLDIDPKKTKTNATAFADFSVAMAKSGLGSAASGIGNLVSGIADGIGKLFGNKDAITKFVEFTKLDVDPDKAEKLGIAFAAYVSAIQGVAGAAMPNISSSRGAAAAPAAAGAAGGGTTGAAPRVAPSGSSTAGGSVASGSSAPVASSAATASPRQVVPPAPAARSAGRPNDSIEGRVSGGGGPVRQADSGDAAKGPRRKTDGIIVHHTGGRGLQAAISTLKARGLGYHYMVDQDGSVTAFVPDDQKTWHAGTTDKKPELTNSNSVSISLVSKDDTDISPAQLKSGFTLGQELMSKFGASMVYGHGETSSHKMPTEGKTLAEALRSGKLPERKGAASGAMFSGPKSGYPVTLHGNELVVPDFKIPNIKSAMEQTTKQELPFGSTANASGAGNNNLMAEFMTMMENKFNSLIYAVEQSNSTQTQILKYSRA